MAISKLNNPVEAACFLKDLLSAQEAEMLARRLKIAELLIAGLKYSEISRLLKVSPNTIARIHEWLKLSGDGYRLVIDRIGEHKKETAKGSFEENFNQFSWRNVKRRYPMYFWPQLLLENIVKAAKENDKRKLCAILNKMDKKSELYNRLNKLLK